MMNSYLVTLAEAAAAEDAEEFAEILGVSRVAVLDPERTQRIIVQCCPACCRSFIDQVIADADDIWLRDPVVVDIDTRRAKHVPILQTAGE